MKIPQKTIYTLALMGAAFLPTLKAEVIDAKGSGGWSYLQVTDGTDPNIADTDFNSTWYNPTIGGYSGGSYNGPSFTAAAPSPFHYGGVSGLSGGTELAKPSSGSRYTSYFYKVIDGGVDGYAALKLSLLADDGAFVYLNGVLISRDNISGSDTFTKFSDSNGSESAYDRLTLIGSPRLNPGANLLAISVHEVSTTSSDLGFDILLEERPPLAITRGPYLQSASSDRMTVRWRTDAASNSVIRYGDAANNLSQTMTLPANVTEHVVTLTGLSAATKYFYEIASTSATGTISAGAESGYYFKTYPTAGSREATRIWIIGDSGTTNAGKYSLYKDYLNRTGSSHTDAWLMLGDNAYNSGKDSEFQTAVFDSYPELLRNTVLWSCLGNHEAATNAGAPYIDIHTFPTAGECGGVASGSERYYSFDHGNIHFVCIDSQTSGNYNDIPGSGGMVDWLEQDLMATDKDWIIAYFHHGPYTKGSHDSDTESKHIQVRKYITPLLERYGVDFVVSGHSHIYERSMLINGHHSNMGEGDSRSGTFVAADHGVDTGNGSTLGSNTAVHNGAFQISGGTGAYQKPLADGGKGTVYSICGASGKLSGTKSGFPHPVFIVNINDKIGGLILNVDGNSMNAQYYDEDGTLRDDFTIVKGTTVEVSATDPSFAEHGADDTASFTVTRSGAVSFAEDFSYTIGGSATNGGDYTPKLSGTISFAEGETSKVLTVTRVVDQVAEGPESCIVTIASTQKSAYPGAVQRDRYFLGANNAATANLLDNPSQQWWFDQSGGESVSAAQWQSDVDDDGISALLEYALGGADGVNDAGLLPSYQRIGNSLEMLYKKNNALLDIQYQVVSSTDLSQWTSAGVVDSINGASNPDGEEEHKAVVSASNEPNLFLRLEVIRQ